MSAAVLGRLVAAVLHLGAHRLDVQPQAADAGQLPPVALDVGARRDPRGAGRLEVRELAGQDRGLLVRVVDDLGAAEQLDAGVVATWGRRASGSVPGSAFQAAST